MIINYNLLFINNNNSLIINRNHFCSILTSLYAIFVLVFAVIVELSKLFDATGDWLTEMLFYTYMYVAALMFMACFYMPKRVHAWAHRSSQSFNIQTNGDNAGKIVILYLY